MNAPAAFERQTSGGSFVTYEASPSRAPIQIKVGDTVEQVVVHPEVFIREYPYIKIKEITASGKGNGLYVQFDPASVPVPEGKERLSRPIAVSTLAGGEIEAALRQAHLNDVPLYMAMELRRKYKSADGSVIGYDVPIMELRGFTEDGESTDAAQGSSRANISKVLALIGPAANPDVNLISTEAKSNPLDWPAHRSNRVGKTPAQGWVRITRPDGTPGGAAIPRQAMQELTGPAGSVTFDDAVLARIADAVAARMGAANADPTITRPPQRTSRSAEGKRWDLFNSDGRVNPGSYAVTGLLAVRDTALSAVENAMYTEQADADAAGRAPQLLTRPDISALASKLMVPLSNVADTVQSSMTGKPANRVDGSATTAGKILRQVVLREVPLTVAIIDDDSAKAQWLQEVTDAALAVAQSILAATDTYLGGVAAPTPINDASGRAQRAVNRQNPPVDPKAAPATSTGAAAPATPPATSPANTGVSAPPTANFDTDTPASPSTADRNAATLAPLLETVQLQVEHIQPLLAQQLQTDDLADIDPDLLATRVQAWSQDPARFRSMAQAAYQAAYPQAS